jgi:DNA-binding LacI/PurR family transcriptional regulator
LATLQDIADQAGVSTETVSRVLRGKYRQVGPRGVARVEQVTQIARDLGYRANAAARSMKNQESLLVGVVMPVDQRSRIAHPLIMEITFGLNSVLADAGYVMNLLPVDHTEIESGVPQSRGLLEQVADGYVVIDGIGPRLEDHIAAEDKPIVWANAECGEGRVSVLRDEFRAGELAVEALAAAGHRRVVSIERQQDWPHYSFAHRHRGVTTAAARLGLEVQIQAVGLNRDGMIGDDATAHRALEALADTGAAVLADTYLARRVISAIARSRISVADLSLACCDDADEWGEIMPWLPRASFDRFQMGRRAGSLLLRQLAGRRAESVVMQPEWKSGQAFNPDPPPPMT